MPLVETFVHMVTHIIWTFWDLSLVQLALQKSPFKPIWDIPLADCASKIVYLKAIISANRVSELAALSSKEPITFIKVVVRPQSYFLLKGNLWPQHTL